MRCAGFIYAFLFLFAFPRIGNGGEPELSPWFGQLQFAGTAHHLNDEGNPYRISAGVGRALTDRLDGMIDLVYGYYEVNAVKDRNPGVTVQSGNSSSLGVDLRLRYRFFGMRNIDGYLQGGTGLQSMIDDPPFPADGSTENFTLFLGAGGLFPLTERWRLAVTLQWFHISNARMRPNNSGYDGIQLVVSPEWHF